MHFIPGVLFNKNKIIIIIIIIIIIKGKEKDANCVLPYSLGF